MRIKSDEIDHKVISEELVQGIWRLDKGSDRVLFQRLRDNLWYFTTEASAYRKMIAEACNSVEREAENRIILPKWAQSRLDGMLSSECLDDSQRRAIHSATKSRFSLIHGPPGTGKTTVITYLLNYLLQSDYSLFEV